MTLMLEIPFLIFPKVLGSSCFKHKTIENRLITCNVMTLSTLISSPRKSLTDFFGSYLFSVSTHPVWYLALPRHPGFIE